MQRKTWNQDWGTHTECTGCGKLWRVDDKPTCECQEIIESLRQSRIWRNKNETQS